MDGRRFDQLARAMAGGVGRRRVLRGAALGGAALLGRSGLLRAVAQKDCTEDCPDGRTCVDGKCVKPCRKDRNCHNDSDDACMGSRCEDGVCADFVADCSAGYVCCNHGQCCPISCTTDVDCRVGDPCQVGTCGTEGVCQFTRRDPCVTCTDDAGCASVSSDSICCEGSCIRRCPEGTVLSKGCECRASDVTGNAEGVMVVDNNSGASNVQVTPEPTPTPAPTAAPTTTTSIEAPPQVTEVAEPPR